MYGTNERNLERFLIITQVRFYWGCFDLNWIRVAVGSHHVLSWMMVKIMNQVVSPSAYQALVDVEDRVFEVYGEPLSITFDSAHGFVIWFAYDEHRPTKVVVMLPGEEMESDSRRFLRFFGTSVPAEGVPLHAFAIEYFSGVEMD